MRTTTTQAAQADEPRTALVIGNASYSEGPLRNPANDAQDVAVQLEKLGFKVTRLTNATKRQMEDAIRQFGLDLRRGGVGLFYYSGHGIQSKGENYIIPIGAEIKSDADTEFESVNVGRVLAQMGAANNRLNVLILDACRNDPFPRQYRDATKGLAVINSAQNMFIAYSTSPGAVASDGGTGRNSPYTMALVESLRNPESRIEDVFKRTARAVSEQTRGQQNPWISTSFYGDFWFDPRGSRPAALSSAALPPPTNTRGPSANDLDAIRRLDEELAKPADPPRNAIPTLKVAADSAWPKPLPNNWTLGSVTGLDIDTNDHVWILNEGGTAPPVVELDVNGNFITAWRADGQGYDWPKKPHGITVDFKGNVWVGGSGANDNMILKFTQAGKFLMQIGRPGNSKGSMDVENFGGPEKIFVDRATNEVFVSDGYFNHRVIAFDADIGRYKRHWGAFGNKPEDTNLGPYNPDAPPAKQFRTVSCAVMSVDKLVYVCDPGNNRIQVFRPDGTFVKDKRILPASSVGIVWDMALSSDPQQKYIYVADGQNNNRVYILDRQSLDVTNVFGETGEQPGAFANLSAVAVDSGGKLYTGQLRGKTIQRWNVPRK